MHSPLILRTIGLFILPFILSGSLFAQKRQNFLKRYWNALVNDTTPSKDPKFIMYPTFAYAPETSWELGISSMYLFYANRDTTNRLSEVNAFTFYTLKSQVGIWIDHNIYGPRNNWFFFGRARFQSFPILYHGIGPDTPAEHLAVVDANQFQLKERVLTRAIGNFYAGLEMDIQSMGSVNFHSITSESYVKPLGSEGSTNVAFGAGILYDNRHNVLNVREGLFSELAFLRYHPYIGSAHQFSTIISDTRIFRPVNKRDVLAAQLFGQFSTGNVPFNQLSLLGGESIMRGYYMGRYRDQKLVATQIEYRFLPLPFKFTNRIGAALFVGTGTVFSHLQNFNINNLVVAGGGGLRFLIFPKKDIFTRLDVAFTREGPGLYIFIGEAF